jgi:hypothetical protein
VLRCASYASFHCRRMLLFAFAPVTLLYLRPAGNICLTPDSLHSINLSNPILGDRKMTGFPRSNAYITAMSFFARVSTNTTFVCFTQPTASSKLCHMERYPSLTTSICIQIWHWNHNCGIGGHGGLLSFLAPTKCAACARSHLASSLHSNVPTLVGPPILFNCL